MQDKADERLKRLQLDSPTAPFSEPSICSSRARSASPASQTFSKLPYGSAKLHDTTSKDNMTYGDTRLGLTKHSPCSLDSSKVSATGEGAMVSSGSALSID